MLWAQRSRLLAFAMVSAMWFGLPCGAQDTNAARAKILFDAGVARVSRGEYEAAIVEFSKAVDLDPQNAVLYAARGNARINVGTLDEAIGDFTKAIELAPSRRAPYINRGVAKVDKGDLDGALSDYSKVIEADAKNVTALRNRGCAKQQKGDLEGARADFIRAVELSAGEAGAYSRFYLFLLGFRQMTPVARSELKGVVVPWKDGWKKTIGLFLVGDIPEAAFLELAAQGTLKVVREQKCEAFYYAGAVRLAKGDALGAKDLFERCVGTQLHTFPEFQLARGELVKIAKNAG